jgi:hypothetical protein
VTQFQHFFEVWTTFGVAPVRTSRPPTQESNLTAAQEAVDLQTGRIVNGLEGCASYEFAGYAFANTHAHLETET